MSCEHCKDRLPRLITIDPLKDRLIDSQALKLNRQDALIKKMVELISDGLSQEALDIGAFHTKQQLYRG